MLNINNVMIGGAVANLKEAETHGGKKIAKFTIVTWSYKGEGKPDAPVFHDCVCYGAKAEVIIKHVSNKDLLFVEGEVDQFETTEGKRISTVLVREFSFVNKKTA